MPVIVNSQLQLGKTTEYRLSIQADLNGFSFSIVDDKQHKPLYVYASDFSMDRDDMALFSKRCSEILKNTPVLRGNFKKVEIIYGTEKYSLIPASLHEPGNDLKELSALHKLDDLDEINIAEVKRESMKILFAVNSTFLNVIKKYQPHFSIFPTVYPFVKYLPHFSEHNKILFHYIKGAVNIVAAEGNRVIFCNTFPVVHFNSALYFLLLALKETQFNSELTTVYVGGNIKDLEIFDISKYFSSVKYFRNPSIPLPDQFSEMKYSSMMFDL
jgi:hypothetical protein